jgi:hypothetical protein
MEKQVRRPRKTRNIATTLPKVRMDIATGQIYDLEEARQRINQKLHLVNWRLKMSA